MQRRMKGDGSIYYDEKRKLYVGQITLGTDENGKRKRKTVYGKTKAEVRAKLQGVTVQIYTGTFTDNSEITFYHLAKQMLDDKLNQNEIKESTYSRHVETLKILKEIHHIPLQDFTETQLRTFLNGKLNYSQSIINKVYEMINKTFREAQHRQIISVNPTDHIKKPKSKKKTVKVRAFTKDEQKRFLDVLSSYDINYKEQMLLSMFTGMRMGEVNALHVDDIDFKNKQIKIRRTVSRDLKGRAYISDTPKTAAGQRDLFMTDEISSLLKTCIGKKKSGLIFGDDKPLTTNTVNCQFDRVLKKYDILDKTITDGKIDLHSLRHTFGTRCAEAGMPPKVLQEIMGHTDIKITMNTYFYATKDYIEEYTYKIDNILKGEGLSIGNTKTIGNK